ncbi:MAG: pyrrolo-quinoline quinone, partial [Pirellulaceae bacterium]|nr:pyrrolo-quinoline quinone [Pirellulaceae bacterium]
MLYRALVTLFVLLLFSPAAKAENWPQWRGPHANSVVPAGDYPARWSAEEGVLWKVDLPGKGSSTPAIWGDNLFLTY